MSKYADVKITFGTHKGKPFGDIPTTYLCWLHEKYDGIMIDLDEIKKILKKRGCTFKHGEIQIPMEIIREEEPALYERYQHKLHSGWIREFLDNFFEHPRNYFEDDCDHHWR